MKERSWQDRIMISKIERILDEYHVSMGQYHGRDLEGPACANLLTNANAIFNRIKALLLDKCRLFVPCDEIEDMCNRYCELFLLLEGVFHFMQKPNELLNDQIEYYHGIGDFNEEFIEQLHQETKKFQKRMGHLSDYQKQINAMVVLNRLENLDKVKAAQEKVVARLGSTDGFGSSVPTNHQRHVADHVENTASSNQGTTE